ncbi:hypothetical protein [Acidithiobacillus ferriphilus]|uniref:hypothetical protein n=1 Tax=Acidithiobacillus ferriphilus TaxID=1689834 RepID=UPI002DBC593A|nr:hypothetical protein [Acidithiobacillus ferriphilus]MEB8536556.1 hypothetical protein [Acidithiobacillus ferriphilus]
MTAKPSKTAIVQQIAPTNSLQVIESPEINRHPSPRLGTAAELRMEMARLYRDARTGQVEITDATKLAYILTQLATLMRIDDLEQRTAALERVLKAEVKR